MTASFTTGSDPRFPAGTVLYVWPEGGAGRPKTPTAVTSTTVASDSTATFTGLEYSAPYLAGTAVSGPFINFQTDAEPPPEDAGGPDDGSVTLASLSEPLLALLAIGRVHDGANYPERIDGAAFNHWVGPSEPPDFENGDVWTPTT